MKFVFLVFCEVLLLTGTVYISKSISIEESSALSLDPKKTKDPACDARQRSALLFVPVRKTKDPACDAR